MNEATNTLGGAASGAMSGASIGMLGGPIGALIGGGVGALVGGVSGWLGSPSDPKKRNSLMMGPGNPYAGYQYGKVDKNYKFDTSLYQPKPTTLQQSAQITGQLLNKAGSLASGFGNITKPTIPEVLPKLDLSTDNTSFGTEFKGTNALGFDPWKTNNGYSLNIK